MQVFFRKQKRERAINDNDENDEKLKKEFNKQNQIKIYDDRLI